MIVRLDLDADGVLIIKSDDAGVVLEDADAEVPVEISGDGDDAAMLAELKALREEMELLPVHLRDALITSQ